MPETNELQQALNPPAAGNEAPATPGAVTPPPAAPPAPPEDELPSGVRELLAKNPDHQPIVDLINREMKAAFTPRLQEAAELRKRIDGIDPQNLDALRQLQSLSPAARAAQLRAWADQMGGQPPQQPAAQPQAPPEPDFITETERRMWQAQQDLQRRIEAVDQTFQQRAHIEQARQVGHELNTLAQKYGVEISDTLRMQTFQLVQQTGLPVESALLAAGREAVLPRILQQARDQAASVTQEKAGVSAGNPGSLVSRADGTPPTPRDFRSHVARELAEAGET